MATKVGYPWQRIKQMSKTGCAQARAPRYQAWHHAGGIQHSMFGCGFKVNPEPKIAEAPVGGLQSEEVEGPRIRGQGEEGAPVAAQGLGLGR